MNAEQERFAKYVAEKGWTYVDASRWIDNNGCAQWVDRHIIEKHVAIDEERSVFHELGLPNDVFDIPDRWDRLIEMAEAGFKRAIVEES